ncbi:serine/threonine protein kinase [Fonticula alba]|uniref:non-specific serine/threonine protein kinase n=1 Tax=Fonticula alba TaxID=691883 RepID=A0A058Z3W9_FONAL|nr:serine/threonine protein kinase [Fonticula alba]KCV68613.1 serine/threonine protein kinase [Fonticula alba]|eukprot:XP_009497045.1 serine/threonine protein kinase [Fonticula alba]
MGHIFSFLRGRNAAPTKRPGGHGLRPGTMLQVGGFAPGSAKHTGLCVEFYPTYIPAPELALLAGALSPPVPGALPSGHASSLSTGSVGASTRRPSVGGTGPHGQRRRRLTVRARIGSGASGTVYHVIEPLSSLGAVSATGAGGSIHTPTSPSVANYPTLGAAGPPGGGALSPSYTPAAQAVTPVTTEWALKQVVIPDAEGLLTFLQEVVSHSLVSSPFVLPLEEASIDFSEQPPPGPGPDDDLPGSQSHTRPTSPEGGHVSHTAGLVPQPDVSEIISKFLPGISFPASGHLLLPLGTKGTLASLVAVTFSAYASATMASGAMVGDGSAHATLYGLRRTLRRANRGTLRSGTGSRLTTTLWSARVLRILSGAARGLLALHQSGHAFRDLKPANILLLPVARAALAPANAATVGSPDGGAAAASAPVTPGRPPALQINTTNLGSPTGLPASGDVVLTGVLMDLGSVEPLRGDLYTTQTAAARRAIAERAAVRVTAPFRAPELFDPAMLSLLLAGDVDASGAIQPAVVAGWGMDPVLGRHAPGLSPGEASIPGPGSGVSIDQVVGDDLAARLSAALDARTDTFALGCTLYAALAGGAPGAAGASLAAAAAASGGTSDGDLAAAQLAYGQAFDGTASGAMARRAPLPDPSTDHAWLSFWSANAAAGGGGGGGGGGGMPRAGSTPTLGRPRKPTALATADAPGSPGPAAGGGAALLTADARSEGPAAGPAPGVYPDVVVQLLDWLLDTDPRARPSMAAVVRRIDEVLLELEPLLEPGWDRL